mgnify:CR=1 FL=1
MNNCTVVKLQTYIDDMFENIKKKKEGSAEWLQYMVIYISYIMRLQKVNNVYLFPYYGFKRFFETNGFINAHKNMKGSYFKLTELKLPTVIMCFIYGIMAYYNPVIFLALYTGLVLLSAVAIFSPYHRVHYYFKNIINKFNETVRNENDIGELLKDTEFNENIKNSMTGLSTSLTIGNATFTAAGIVYIICGYFIQQQLGINYTMLFGGLVVVSYMTTFCTRSLCTKVMYVMYEITNYYVSEYYDDENDQYGLDEHKQPFIELPLK